MPLFIVRYDETLRRVKKVIDQDVEEEFERIWDNADQGIRADKGPIQAVALWFTDVIFVLVDADNEEMAIKLALDWVNPGGK